MARDVELVLLEGVTLTATGAQDYIEVEGGLGGICRIWLGTLATGSSPTLDLRLQASLDAGSNYYKFGQAQQIINTDDNKELAFLAYIPRPALANNKVRLRLHATLGGSGGSFEIVRAVFEPRPGFDAMAIDERLSIGLAALLSSS